MLEISIFYGVGSSFNFTWPLDAGTLKKSLGDGAELIRGHSFQGMRVSADSLRNQHDEITVQTLRTVPLRDVRTSLLVVLRRVSWRVRGLKLRVGCVAHGRVV